MSSPTAGETRTNPNVAFLGAAGAGALVAVALGVYGKVHDPASETTIQWFFTSTLHFKAWLTTVAVVLAIIQLLGALWMYGKLGSRPAPSCCRSPAASSLASTRPRRD